MIYYRGVKLTIVFAVRTNGSCPGWDYLKGCSDDVGVSFDQIAVRLADQGQIFNYQQFRPIHGKGKFFEIKPKGIRFMGFFRQTSFVITHGFKKRGGGKNEKFPQKELKKALEIQQEFNENRG
ncbi:type II toxin-antitoxin system RelE/ParE family toxin [bacterium]|nr:type II toxin-antitoxin system RelE/ParE family toxin [bacterium]